jgi:hypothetical protein
VTYMEHGFVLGLHRDDVLALGLVEMSGTLERQIVRLGRATGPNDFARIGADQIRNLPARFFNCSFRLPAPRMTA